VDGININYVKVGSGPKPILCLPGALGQYSFLNAYLKLKPSKLTVEYSVVSVTTC
jgi:hypothetical protein